MDTKLEGEIKLEPKVTYVGGTKVTFEEAIPEQIIPERIIPAEIKLTEYDLEVEKSNLLKAEQVLFIKTEQLKPVQAEYDIAKAEFDKQSELVAKIEAVIPKVDIERQEEVN